MGKFIKQVVVSSLSDATSKSSDILNIFKDEGILVVKGYRFSTEEQVELVKSLGDVLDWNIYSESPQMTADSATYQGGHSDNSEKEYEQKTDEYVLDWHIEQVYYIHPILAGIWSMTKFTADPSAGNTRFVDSIELFRQYSQEDQDFLAKSVAIWDKPTPQGRGPFYTKVVDAHPISGEPTLRVETDKGSYMMPELYLLNGVEPTEEQKVKFKILTDRLKTELNTNEDIRYTQRWEEGDVLIVDLFRMYHAVMGGFNYGERQFTGIGTRPKVYDNSMYIDLGLL